MIQISLTRKQLHLIKDALDSFDSGFLETEQECTEFNGLKQYIDYRFMQQAKEEEGFAEIRTRIAQYEATTNERRQLNKGE